MWSCRSFHMTPLGCIVVVTSPIFSAVCPTCMNKGHLSVTSLLVLSPASECLKYTSHLIWLDPILSNSYHRALKMIAICFLPKLNVSLISSPSIMIFLHHRFWLAMTNCLTRETSSSRGANWLWVILGPWQAIAK